MHTKCNWEQKAFREFTGLIAIVVIVPVVLLLVPLDESSGLSEGREESEERK